MREVAAMATGGPVAWKDDVKTGANRQGCADFRVASLGFDHSIGQGVR